MSDPYTLHTMDNGLRIVIERMPHVKSAAAGFLCKTGARDETPDLAGASHYLEHMCFKGSAKRDWREISVDFDKIGSTYNAFTGEDRTFYFGWVPIDRIESQIEILADMMRPSLPNEEFEMEKKVILEEIAMSKDSLDHVMFDFALERVFKDHPLGWPILGYDSTVEALTRDQLHAYYQTRYAADNLTLIVAGNVDPAQIIEMAEKYCGTWESNGGVAKRLPPAIQKGSANKVVERFNQQIVALCYAAPSGSDALNDTAEATASILGGSNSRFYWNIVQAGLSPSASAFRYDLTDCGLTILYGQTEPEGVDKLADALRKEAKAISESPVDEHEIQRVKNRRRTTLAVEGESPYHRLVQIMDDVNNVGDPRTVEQRLADVEAVTVDSVSDFLRQYPIDGEGFLVSVGPRDWPGTSSLNV